MNDIEPVGKYGMTVDQDVAEMLRGLQSGQRYAARDLYERYAGRVKDDGRTPGHPVAVGQALRRLGCGRVKMNVKGRQIVTWVV